MQDIIRVQIANFRGIKTVDFILDQLTLIVGENWMGKSSIAQAFGAALTGNVSPFEGIPKSKADLIVRNGEKQGMITVENNGSSMTMNWPESEFASTGPDVLNASNIAVGFDSVMHMKPKARQDYFSDLLKISPTYEALVEQIKDAKLPESELKRLWDTIESLGWETAYNNAREAGTKMKGKWEYVTSEKYGIRKADKWLPGEWEPDLLNIKRDKLEAELKAAQEWSDAATKDAVITENEIEKLTELAGKVESLKKKSEHAFKQTIKHNGDLQELKDKARKIQVSHEEATPCPNCEHPLRVENGSIIKAESLSTEELAEAEKKLKKINKEIDAQEKALQNAHTVHSEYKSGLDEALSAVEQLKEIKSSDKKTDDKSKAGKEDVAARLEKATRRLEAFDKKVEADELHKDIQRSIIIVKALSPDGLRLDIMSDTIAQMQKDIDAINKETGWKDIKINTDLSVSYGELPYVLHSESEQYRIESILQLFIAKKQKAPAVILDRADILDNEGKNGLIGAILNAGIPALVLMTLSDKKDVPGMSDPHWNAYWISEGELEEIK